MSGIILGDDLEAEVVDPLLTIIEATTPVEAIEALGPPEMFVDVTVPDLGSIEMDVVATDVLVLPVTGPQGPPGQDGQSDVLTGVAGETLSGHRVVVGTDLLFYADPDLLTHTGRATYLTLGAALSGDSVQIIAHGRVTEPSWSWTPGVAIYLSTAGQLTQVVPTAVVFLRTVGWAETATRIYFAPQMPIALV